MEQQPFSDLLRKMTILRDIFCSDTVGGGGLGGGELRTSGQNPEKSKPSILLRLPPEIRRQIYQQNPVDHDSRNPSANAPCLTRLPDGWKDPSSLLLLLNSQLRAEFVSMVQNYSISFRVTH